MDQNNKFNPNLLTEIERAAQIAAQMFDDPQRETASLDFLAQICSTLVQRANNESIQIKLPSTSTDNNDQIVQEDSTKRSRESQNISWNFQCQICFQVFDSEKMLLQHATDHLEVKMNGSRRLNKCPVCAKEFSKPAHLITHLRIHTGEKPFKCRECSKRFAQKSTLNRHRKVHLGKHSYECTDCAQMFSRDSDLQSHMKDHQMDDAKKCLVCQKHFLNVNHLHRHYCHFSSL